MKVTLRSLPAIAFAASLVFTACQKENKEPTTPTDKATQVQAQVEDQNRISGEFDNAAIDINAAVEANASFSGRTQNTLSICSANAVADTANGNRRITITYNGPNCEGTAFRTGTIVLSMANGVRWKDAGAVINVSFQNFKVKRLSDNKSVTINGTQTHTNVSGGLLFQLAQTQQIVHTVRGTNHTITFDDNTQRTWSVARRKTYTYNNGIVLNVEGIGTSGSITNAAEWGTNRFGNAFTTAITQPLVIRQDCNFRLTAGELKHTGDAEATVTFGLNAQGQPTGCPGANKYFMKLVWAGPMGASITAILPY